MNRSKQQVDSRPAIPLPVVILCGGRSRRMGTDKTRLPFGSGTVLSHIEDTFATMATCQIIVIGRDAVPPQSLHNPLIVRDEQLDLGPMEGLRVGLNACLRIGAPLAMITTGDAPMVSLPLYRFMVEALEHDPRLQGVVPFVGETWHPLTATYRTGIVDVVTARIDAGQFRVKDLVDSLQVLKLTADSMERYDPGLQSIRNINTRQQYWQMRSELESTIEPERMD
jgi:molybdopterin-guanine dinucleotide biosynthesis protein A